MTKRLILSTLCLAGLVGCGTPALDTRMYHGYQEYLTRPHYRAFAATAGTSERLAAAYGWSSNRGSVETAVERALAGCKKGEKKYFNVRECNLFAVGDIKVAGMSEEQVGKAIAFYTSNRHATNDDLILDAAKTMVSGAEIQELYASGAILSGIFNDTTTFTVKHFVDGTATTSWKSESDSGNDTGIWRVNGDQSWKKWDSLFDGVERCWTVYRVGDGRFLSYTDDRLVAKWSIVK